MRFMSLPHSAPAMSATPNAKKACMLPLLSCLNLGSEFFEQNLFYASGARMQGAQTGFSGARRESLRKERQQLAQVAHQFGAHVVGHRGNEPVEQVRLQGVDQDLPHETAGEFLAQFARVAGVPGTIDEQ